MNDRQALHVAVAGPMAGADLASLLGCGVDHLPKGYGGAPLVAGWVRWLLRRGHRVTAVTLSADLLRPSGEASQCQVVEARDGTPLRAVFCPMRPRAWPFDRGHRGRIVDLYRLERRHLARVLADSGADLVHAHWCYEFGAAALASGLPHLVTCHDVPRRITQMQDRWRTRGYRWLRQHIADGVLHRAGAASAVSPYVFEELKPRCPSAMWVVPNAVDRLSPARPSDEQLRRPAGCRVLVVAHGFDRRKNTAAALRAAACLSARRAGVQLVMVGDGHEPDGPARQWWAAQAGAASLDVRFVGPCPPAEVASWMRHSDVLLHPAREEAFGLAPAEALMQGLPVVAARGSGGLPWVLGDAAVWSDADDPASMAAAIESLLADASATARRVGLAADQLAQRFGRDAVGAQYEHCYREVLARAGGPNLNLQGRGPG